MNQQQQVPISLQSSRNTKKLSLSIYPSDFNDTITNSNKNIPTDTNVVLPQTQVTVRKPSLIPRRSEASIYSNSMLKPSEMSPSTLNFTTTNTDNNNNNNNNDNNDNNNNNNNNNKSNTVDTSLSVRAHAVKQGDDHIPAGISRNHSLSLSVNTQVPYTHSRSRSRTLDTSTPLPRGLSSLKTALPLNPRCIPSQPTASMPSSNGKTTWVFPETNGNIQSDMNNSTSNNMYEEVLTRNAYPNGPLLVIPPNIYLYSEPKLDEILDFHVIINVAEEIPNLQYLIPPEFHGKIEYYHIEWSHQSNIVKDLRRLTEIMHNATLQNKKILIHCQCGVSRSASLMVAYIMRYCNMNLNDAYNKLKSIAKDISPNMGLIFQLMQWDEEIMTMITNDVTKDNQCDDDDDDDKISIDNSTNESSINTSSDLTPRTPLGFNKGSDFTTLNT
ncbi:tyrosine-protein phosphatase Msg5p [Monosporozyma servazzii]